MSKEENKNKPLVIIQNEFKEEIAELLNKYMGKLPVFIIRDHINALAKSYTELAEYELQQVQSAYLQREESNKDE